MTPTAISTPSLLDPYCWVIKLIKAIRHKKKPTKGIHLLAPICCASLNPTKFTMANMSKNPTLPAIEMLEIGKILAAIIVTIAVINKPLGCPHNVPHK